MAESRQNEGKRKPTKVRYVYVIGWQAVVFGINSANIENRRSKIVRGKAKHYFLLICNARTIYPKYHSLPSKPAILLQINLTIIATVALQLLLNNSNLKNNHCKKVDRT